MFSSLLSLLVASAAVVTAYPPPVSHALAIAREH